MKQRTAPIARRTPLARSGGIARSAPPKRRTRVNPRNAERRATEFPRTYHSAARVTFVGRRPCANCGRRPSNQYPSHNAHVVRDGSEGMSRKGGYRCVAPLCFLCHPLQEAGAPGPWARYAAETQAAWLAHSGTTD